MDLVDYVVSVVLTCFGVLCIAGAYVIVTCGCSVQ